MSRPSPSSPTTSLPPELWLQIFSELTSRRFPMKDLDYKLLRCRNPFRICRKLHRSQPWIAHSLLLVCKSWNCAVKPLLYETIFLSKASQIKHLASMLRGQALPNPTHPNTSSWIKRLVVMISNPKDRIHSSDFGQLMSSCHNLAALHVVMHLPDESSTNRRHPSSHLLFHNILHAASTLHTLNLISCIPAYSENAISGDFFDKMRALRAFRCDNDVFLPKLNNTSIKALDYLSVGEWTLEEAMDGCDGWPSMAVGELSVGDILSVPVSISYPENQQHLRRLNLDIAHSLPTPRSDSTDDQIQAAHNLPGGSGIDIDGQGSEVLMEEEGEGQQEGDGADQEVDNASSVISISSENLQIGALDVLPPTITYLSILIRRWEDLSGRIRITRLPASVTALGLEAGEGHSTDASYRYLVRMCRDLIAPGLGVVQLNHWQTCVDLRTRHPGLLKEFVEMLGNRNVELWDSEGYVMEGTAL